MKICRGDIVLVTLPFAQGTGSKLRPAMVVQNDAANSKLANTIVVAITRNVSRAHLATQLLVDPTTPIGKPLGLLASSAVTCENIFTVGHNLIQRIIGHAPPSVMRQIDECLKKTLEIT